MSSGDSSSSASSSERSANSKKVWLVLFALDREENELERLDQDAKSIGLTVEREYSDELNVIISEEKSDVAVYEWLQSNLNRFYEAVAPTIDLVSLQWLNKSIAQKHPLDPKGFLLPHERRRRRVAKTRLPATTNFDFIIPRYICQRRFPMKHSNRFLTENLNVLVSCLKLHNLNEDEYRSLAYQKAVASLKSLPYDVQSVDELTETIDLGGECLKIIEELLTQGTCAKIEQIRSSSWFKTVSTFNQIRWVGPAIANQWFKAGARNIKDVFTMAYQDADFLRQDPRIYAGLMFYKDLSLTLINIKRGQKMLSLIQRFIRMIFPNEFHEFYFELISFRRGKTQVSSIELLITHPDQNLCRQALTQLHSELFQANFVLYCNFKKMFPRRRRAQTMQQAWRQRSPAKVKSSKSRSLKAVKKEKTSSSSASSLDSQEYEPEAKPRPTKSGRSSQRSTSASSQESKKASSSVRRHRSTSSGNKSISSDQSRSTRRTGKLEQASAPSASSSVINTQQYRRFTIPNNVMRFILKLPHGNVQHVEDNISRPVNEFSYVREGQAQFIRPRLLRDLFANRNWTAVHLDIFTCPHQELPFQLLNLTGNRLFVRNMRLFAKRERNCLLNQKQLQGPNGPIECETEQEIFEALGLEYVYPYERNP